MRFYRDEELLEFEHNKFLPAYLLVGLFAMEVLRFCCSSELQRARHRHKYHYRNLNTLRDLDDELVTVKREQVRSLHPECSALRWLRMLSTVTLVGWVCARYVGDFEQIRGFERQVPEEVCSSGSDHKRRLKRKVQHHVCLIIQSVSQQARKQNPFVYRHLYLLLVRAQCGATSLSPESRIRGLRIS